jgi:hypothetical protein
VLQANKRDLPDAMPLGQLRCVLDELEMKMGIVESVATEGSGIREAFVLAVRLALDRVREFMRLGQLAQGRPSIDTPQDLLRDLKQREDSSLDLSVSDGLKHIRLSHLRGNGLAQDALEQVLREHAESHSAPTDDPAATPTPQGDSPDGECPKAPDEGVASGMVWPPIDGRTVLQEIGASAVRLQCSVDGEWSGIVNERWRILTSQISRFSTAEQGRRALIELARAYSANMRPDSPERCAALAPDGHGAFRLWQITRLEQSAAT